MFEETVAYINNEAAAIESHLFNPKTAIILWSWWASLTDKIATQVELNFNDIPHFPQKVQQLQGHASKMLLGTLWTKDIIVLNWRYHYYEWFNGEEIAYPVRVLKDLGIENLILTNASGSLSRSYVPWTLYAIKNHTSVTMPNPLIWENYAEYWDRFVPQWEPYNEKLLARLVQTARNYNKHLGKVVYAGVTWPTFESAPDVKILWQFGDVAGMSTVPEAIVANHAWMNVVGMTIVSNYWQDVTPTPISHDEVCAMVANSVPKYASLIADFIKKI
jgi:purine-nucleoside phosphorylase